MLELQNLPFLLLVEKAFHVQSLWDQLEAAVAVLGAVQRRGLYTGTLNLWRCLLKDTVDVSIDEFKGRVGKYFKETCIGDC